MGKITENGLEPFKHDNAHQESTSKTEIDVLMQKCDLNTQVRRIITDSAQESRHRLRGRIQRAQVQPDAMKSRMATPFRSSGGGILWLSLLSALPQSEGV